jgi:hypothetical protein
MSRFAVKFFRYAKVWRYKEIGQEGAKAVDTHALERILGVTGGPLVYVCRDVVNKGLGKLRIEVRNGFITRASLAEDDTIPFTEGAEVTEFYVRALSN